MTRAYSNDLRKRVVDAVRAGDSCRAAAKRFGVAVSTVVKWSQRYRETGSVAPGKMGGHRRPILDPHRAFIIERIAQTPRLCSMARSTAKAFAPEPVPAEVGMDQQLIRALKPGAIVVTDNLGSHKSSAVREAIKRAGARLWFLPPYSPDLNPIEQMFAKIKHWMRMAQKRTTEDVWRHAGRLPGAISPDECANYFENAGYASVKT